MAGGGPIEVLDSCSCGATVARSSRSRLVVCTHVDDEAALILSSHLPPAALVAAVRALEAAVSWLSRPATSCSCPKALVGDLDPDPDCPGLAAGDGCRADSRIRSWAVLREVGLRYHSHSLRVERETLTAALEHARALMAPPVPAPVSLVEAAPVVIVAPYESRSMVA